ncbi:MAG: nickel-responsive transcriptional regulator NikR [Thermoanaerobaculales bacterium]|jgi:CopG family nickel-responsive transcriptional regulator|nr:nickel-responsive transcriptional regulator NikR [Thermoanaerobaculales bacterium]
MELERISITVERDDLRRFDELLQRRQLGNRSEALRDLIRRRLIDEEIELGSGPAVASLTLVYDHEQRELARQLVSSGHAHHAQVLSVLHMHLDERLCLEVQILQGEPHDLKHYADRLIGLRGVKHGQLVLSSASLWEGDGTTGHHGSH